MESGFHQQGKSFDDASVIILGDSDEEADQHDDSEGVCLTQLEFNILTQRREQFMKSEAKTLEQYQLLIEQELSVLRTILARHKHLGESSVEQNPFVINVKEIIGGLCLDLIVNDPVEVSFWNQYKEFCLDFNHECGEQREEVFEAILAKDIPESVYNQMCYCEHNLSGDYAKARDYLSRGIEKHKDCLELYTTRLTLEMGECYSRRQEYVPEKMLSQAEKDILFGNHMFETCTAIRSNFDMKEKRIIQVLDNLIQTSCKEFPCHPVHQVKLNFRRDWKQMCPERAVTEVVSLEADILLDAVNENNARATLAAVFRTFWHSFQSCDRNPKILHRAIVTFRSLDIQSTTVRQFLYLILDIGLFYQCLDPEHIDFYFKQLSLENNAVADLKSKYIFRRINCKECDKRLEVSTVTWHAKFMTVFRLCGMRNERQVTRLMNLASTKLGKTRALLTVFTRLFSQMITKLNDDEVVACWKVMFLWLNEQLIDLPSLHEEMRRMLISWLLARGHLIAAKTQFVKLKASEIKTRQDSNLHSYLLGQLFLYNPVKQEPYCS